MQVQGSIMCLPRKYHVKMRIWGQPTGDLYPLKPLRRPRYMQLVRVPKNTTKLALNRTYLTSLY